MGFYATHPQLRSDGGQADTLESAPPRCTSPTRAPRRSVRNRNPIRGPIRGVVSGYRFYDPASVKFLTRDPLGERGGFNLTQAFACNPINVYDSLGCAPTMPENLTVDLTTGEMSIGFEGDIAGRYKNYNVPEGMTYTAPLNPGAPTLIHATDIPPVAGMPAGYVPYYYGDDALSGFVAGGMNWLSLLNNTVYGTVAGVGYGIDSIESQMGITFDELELMAQQNTNPQMPWTGLDDLLVGVPLVLGKFDNAARFLCRLDDPVDTFRALDHFEDATRTGSRVFDIVEYGAKHPGMRKHHGVMDIWATRNVSGYVSRGAKTPAILLTPEQHARTIKVFQAWSKQRYGRSVGATIDWTKVSPKDAQRLTEAMFEAAGVPESARRAYMQTFHRYIYRK